MGQTAAAQLRIQRHRAEARRLAMAIEPLDELLRFLVR